MHEAAEIQERREEELRVAEDELKKSVSIEESVMEEQCNLWCSHYYEYYNLEGSAEEEDEDDDAVDFSRGDVQSTSGGMSPKTSHRRPILHQ
ncbi:hypothetical protein ZWY2020_028584 [Hordeum vulgare]|nr:hypothetical protein ZWY2020_028584 [Hordeum vulgare]